MKICSLHLRIYFGSRGVSFDEQVNAFSSKKGIIYAAMEIKNKTVKMQIDTGESCKVLPCSYLPAGAKIQKTSESLLPTPSPN